MKKRYYELKSRVERLPFDERGEFKEHFNELKQIMTKNQTIMTKVKYGDIFRATLPRISVRGSKIRTDLKEYASEIRGVYKDMVKMLEDSSTAFAMLYFDFADYRVIEKGKFDNFKSVEHLNILITKSVKVYPKEYRNYFYIFDSKYNIYEEEHFLKNKLYDEFIYRVEHMLLKIYRYYVLTLFQIKLFREYLLFWVYSGDYYILKVSTEKLTEMYPPKYLINVERYKHESSMSGLERFGITVTEYTNSPNVRKFGKKRTKYPFGKLNLEENFSIGDDFFKNSYHYMSFYKEEEEDFPISFAGLFSDRVKPAVPRHFKEYERVGAICLKSEIKKHKNYLGFYSRCEEIKIKPNYELGMKVLYDWDREISPKRYVQGQILFFKHIKGAMDNEYPRNWKIDFF